MPDDSGVVRRIAWKQICPWLIIFRIFRISISLPVLVLAVAGAVLTPLGWWLAETAFVSDADLRQPAFQEYVDANSAWPTTRFVPVDALMNSPGWPPQGNPVMAIYGKLTSPFARLLDRAISVTQAAYLLGGGLWNLAVWAFFGSAITRLAAVQLGREERIGMGSALKHVAKNYAWYLLAPLFPLLGLVVASLPVVALGALMRLDAGVVVAGVLWPLALVAGLVMAIFLIGAMFGWPLMFPTISSEAGSDAFEAFSRSFSYTFQRPLHYLFYATVTVLFAAACWLAVSFAAVEINELSLWAASWGGGAARVAAVVQGNADTTLAENGGWLIRRSQGILGVVAAAFKFAIFWCGATAIYLLLRRDADQMDLDEVFLDDEAGRYGLPPLKPLEPEKPESPATSSPEPAASPPENEAPEATVD